MEYYSVMLPLAIVLALSKIFIKICQRYAIPGVIGMIMAGLIFGIIGNVMGHNVFSDTAMEGMGFIAKIGVILIMFTAGLDTDLRKIKSVGGPSVLITLAGVVFPMGLGFVVATLFNGGFSGLTGERVIENLFYGTILTATSVSVTVATLKEIGKLDSKIGTTIISAAVLDDIIGVIVMSFVLGMGNSGAGSGEIVKVVIKTVLFFIAIIAFGILSYYVFEKIEKKYPHHRLIPIFGISLCFLFSYASERFFGVADITGAFATGLVLSKNPEHDYIERKSDVMGYMIFTPVFFANIGLTIKISDINPDIIGFGICFVIAGIVGKLAGCGLMSRACKYSTVDSFRVGLGMMARAEVALICTQKGVESGLVDSSIMPFVVLLIMVTSFITPMLLRLTYKNDGLIPPIQPDSVSKCSSQAK
ncbi:MAG: cation:proton antiporter [Eubacteriales bacterium]|nr:cation:proton antiporter [Eubacteriales bacterium]